MRLLIPKGKTKFTDAVYGPIEVDHKEIDDFIIQRSDGTPTYNFTVVVDDLEMIKVINDDNYADSKIHSYLTMGKSIRLIRYNLLKKGLSSENINNVITKLKESAPDLEIQSAHTFARKKKLGKYGNFKNKEKDFAKMARAGFNYDIVLKVLEYD